MNLVKPLNTNGDLNALTIDVEDWFHVANLKDVIKESDWESCESRINYTMIKIISILHHKNVKATFFVLGWIAERNPEIVELIHEAGHEIGSHGYSHRSIYELSKDEFKREIVTSIDKLSGISGQKIIGFRAPNYSIEPSTKWAWQILAEAGIKYDSSIFPVKHNRYGFDSAPRFPFTIDLNSHGQITEFPLSTIKFLGNNMPVAGGAYLRLYPYWFIRSAIRRINNSGKPAIIYFHPWEIDPEQPRIKTNFSTRIKHYGNLYTTEQKLCQLLDEFKFTTVKEILGY